jgi:hypothetical protein
MGRAGIVPQVAPNGLAMLVALMAAHRAVSSQSDEDLLVFDQAAVGRMSRHLADRTSARDAIRILPPAERDRP